MTRINFTEQSNADIRAIDQPVAIQGLKTIARFLESNEGDVRRLQGATPPLYCLRAQDYRVIFRYEGDSIEVTRVHNRRDAYR